MKAVKAEGERYAEAKAAEREGVSLESMAQDAREASAALSGHDLMEKSEQVR